MKIRNEKMKFNALTLAVQGSLLLMFAVPVYAADEVNDEVAALKRPINSVEIGVGNVSQQSAKFGEYSGLNTANAGVVGNFDLRGGNAYEGVAGGTRWNINGRDLGTTSRSLGGSLSNQGKWDLSIGYDELRHNITDTYQTPQQGAMGGNVFTLPATFGTVNGNPANMNLPGVTGSTRVLTPIQQAAFHTEKVGTTRKNTSFAAAYTFNEQWSVNFDYNHLNQTGAKLIAGASQAGVTGLSTWRAEAVSVLMNPTNYKTDNFNLALNWLGDSGHLTGAYYGSLFRDGYNSLSWQNPVTNNAASVSTCASGGACTYQSLSMSTAPSNEFHQINLTGGYVFSPATKLAGGFSYGRNTQNDSYSSALMFGGALPPQASLNGLVVTTHADLKLTNQTTKDLTLSAAFKYNDRDNRTASNTYLYQSINLAPNAATSYTGVNTPYSNRKTQLELAADYRIAKGQNLRVAYEREDIKRGCNNVVGGAQCVASPSSTEDKLALAYRMKATDSVSLNAGYNYANRKAVFDHNFLSNVGNRASILAGGANSVLNGGDFVGFVAYPYASRKQDMLKAGVNWQASQKLDLGLNGRYSNDKYDAVLGVQDGQSVSINLDATYSYSEESSVAAYASWQNGRRNMRSGANATFAGNGVTANVVPVNTYTNQLTDTSNAIGLNTKHTGLMGGKFELLGDLSYSLDKSRYSTQVPALLTCASTSLANSTLVCGDTPDIKTNVITLKLTGNYQVNKTGKVTLGYLFQQMKSSDFFYNGEAFGFTSGRMMPTGMMSPNYAIHAVAASYTLTF
ncbi:MtrB/PioB family decaheme-associated outer membrane protein [Gallionella capsiferriformans]|uniref:Decaheme-associated outer membrane protein, MtrB/PioB family n=1 Tax=Gallionella capsiferriformans (strain ES-2) TaxID=395494 RepID=D9SHL2_GALCS|nr:MtrB/PioB family decaheme-associated outer membrane protein [Gallionella capsiferriformans]ADL56009.1 decaheme-associated outer membrane protein, MtrB/PioB family [Gallionella capsiferriformans ES-2]